MLNCEICLVAVFLTNGVWYLMAGISASLGMTFLFSSGAWKRLDAHVSTQVGELHAGLPCHSPSQRWFGSSGHFKRCLKIIPCWLPTSQGSTGEKIILKWHNGGLSNGLWQYVWDLWTKAISKAIPDVVSPKAHVFCMLYSTQCTNDTNSKWSQSFLEKYTSVVESTIYQDVLLKPILMKVF